MIEAFKILAGKYDALFSTTTTITRLVIMICSFKNRFRPTYGPAYGMQEY